jgi:serpin B
LVEVVKAMTPQVLEDCARLQNADVILHLPKFKFEPPPMALSTALRALGMKTAFDDPRGSANFNRMAPRKDDEYLKISEVFHKTWLALDEQGTEAAAATAVRIPRVAAARVPRQTPPPPIIVKVDRPFLFAIQHVPSATCLFLGRVTDPSLAIAS